MDKPKFGGPGTKKKACILRTCRKKGQLGQQNYEQSESNIVLKICAKDFIENPIKNEHDYALDIPEGYDKSLQNHENNPELDEDENHLVVDFQNQMLSEIPKVNSGTTIQRTKLSDSIPNSSNKSQNVLSKEDTELFKTLFGFPDSLDEYRKQPNTKTYAVKNKGNDTSELLRSNVQCPHCQKIYQDHSILKFHVLKLHSEHFQCPICDTAKKIEEAEEFKKHVFEHIVHGKGIENQCIQCGYIGKRKIYSREHLQKRGPLHNDECSQCSRKISSYKEYQDHVESQHYGIWKYKCGFEICGEIFDEQSLYLKHAKNHTRKPHTRKIPQKENQSPIEEKIKVQKISQKGICEECGITSNNISTHVRVKHSKVPVKCNLCDEVFSCQQKVDGHKGLVHFKEPCPHCGLILPKKKFSYHILQFHTPDNEKPEHLVCKICKKGFAAKIRLDDHMNTHTGAKPYKCKYCPASFASKGTMLMHQRGHLGIKRKPKKR